MNTTTEDVKAPDSGHDSEIKRRLERPAKGRILAGVASGIARYFSIDVNIVRIAFVVLTIVGFTGLPFFGWMPWYLFGIPLYLAGWILIPEAESGQSIAGTMLHRLQSR